MDIAHQAHPISPLGKEVRDLSQIPATELAEAADFFRDNFGSTLLFFIDPLTFTTQFCSGELPMSLTFAILALTARFSPWSSIEESRAYRTRALEFLQRERDEVSLHVVQAYLIHCVYEVGCGFESSAWIHLGNAVRMAQILRLSVMDKPHSNFDWGRPAPNVNENATTVELKRRTFWSCFFLDRLLSNGRDRPSSIDEKDICCHFPVSEEDLVFRRFHQPPNPSTVGLSYETSSNLYVSLARILSILGEIITWHGRGGRYTDARAPWRSDMPFTELDHQLMEWQRQVPDHLHYSRDTFAALAMLNLFFALIDEESFKDTRIAREAEALLQDDIKAMESLSRFWDLPKYWVR
ncbi:uncharacterized protein N7477_008454 [Penicillium maclennaniae]|uniref:uncharacterized protein n=1 Tax=Penicillium maclennaniae TaxID=1343394 RepID=UPI00253FC43E|nr:uncharacterized protein N7477_008454 [Penicillium maclennaniae]KAJ5666006.1 hypothetical protein N7477_008454 [Penicillium maclennaniae]